MGRRWTISKRPSIKELDRLWADCIKARAGYRSEKSNRADQVLNAHHIAGKPNHLLRWSLDNGICLTKGEHLFNAHRAGRCLEFAVWCAGKRDVSIDDLVLKGKSSEQVDKFEIKTFLKQKLQKFKADFDLEVIGRAK